MVSRALATSASIAVARPSGRLFSIASSPARSRSTSITFAPSATKRVALARPRLPAAPVTMQVLPSRMPMAPYLAPPRSAPWTAGSPANAAADSRRQFQNLHDLGGALDRPRIVEHGAV